MAKTTGQSAREFERLIKAAVAAGYVVKETSNGSHIKLIPPDKTHDIITTTRRSADRRAPKNLRSRLRRQGLEV